MRSFRDSNEIEWTVFEVRRQVLHADASEGAGIGDGWLCFETTTAKRRLLRYPPRWREIADTELTQLLQQATPAPRATWNLGDGVEDGSGSPGT